MIGKWILSALLFAGLFATAQVNLESVEFLEESESETDPLQWEEIIEQIQDLKIYINIADAEMLQTFPFLDIFQIHNLLEYRQRHRKIYSIYELLQIKGFDQTTVALLRSHLDFDPNPPKSLSWSKALEQSSHMLAWRWGRETTPRVGYNPQRRESGLSHYQGPPDRLLFRYRWQAKEKFRVGFTLEKDAGEPFAATHQPLGFDFVSAHAAIKFNGILKEVVIGDFSAESGQGLLLWNSMAMGKNASAIETRRVGQGIRPYAGTDENRFFRGLGLQFRPHKTISWHVILSRNRADATLVDSGFSTLRTSGLHRTATEITQRHNIRIATFANILKWRIQGWEVGLTQVWHRFDIPQIPVSNPDRIFHPQGQFRQGYAANFTRVQRQQLFFGEAGLLNDRMGFVGGWRWVGHSRVAFTLLFRNLQPGFTPLYQAVFEGGNSGNRRGLYAGMEFRAHRKLLITAFADQYRHLWLRHQQDFRGRVSEKLIQAHYQPSRKNHLYLRLTHQASERHMEGEGPFRQTTHFRRMRLRLHGMHQHNDQLRISGRVEVVRVHFNNHIDWGTLMFQELRWQSASGKWVVQSRLALFHTQNFETAIYAFEPDLPMGFAIPAFYGEGQRTVLQVQYKPSGKIEVGLRYAKTRFFDRTSIGSGLDETPGPTRTEIRAYARLRIH
jgi:hypothetical protein